MLHRISHKPSSSSSARSSPTFSLNVLRQPLVQRTFQALPGARAARGVTAGDTWAKMLGRFNAYLRPAI